LWIEFGFGIINITSLIPVVILRTLHSYNPSLILTEIENAFIEGLEINYSICQKHQMLSNSGPRFVELVTRWMLFIRTYVMLLY